MKNPVAKHARTFNNSHVMRDRTKYHRPSANSEVYYEDDWDYDEDLWDDEPFEGEEGWVSPIILEESEIAYISFALI